MKMAKEIFAKTQITYKAAQDKFASIGSMTGKDKEDWANFQKSVNLQVKLQQAQFLAQYYGKNVLAKKLEVTDAEVEKYMKEHPELGDTSKKKARRRRSYQEAR